MKKILSLLLIISFSFVTICAQKGSFAEIKQLQSPQNPKLGFMIHGGAVRNQREFIARREKEYRVKLEEALLALQSAAKR